MGPCASCAAIRPGVGSVLEPPRGLRDEVGFAARQGDDACPCRSSDRRPEHCPGAGVVDENFLEKELSPIGLT